MAVYQAYNKRTKAWVKFSQKKGELAKIINVKEAKPSVPFKGVRIKKTKVRKR